MHKRVEDDFCYFKKRIFRSEKNYSAKVRITCHVDNGDQAKKPLYLYTRPYGLRLFVVCTCVRITFRALMNSSLRAVLILSINDLSSHRQTQKIVIMILTSRYFKELLFFKGNPQKKNPVLFSFVKQHIRLIVRIFSQPRCAYDRYT